MERTRDVRHVDRELMHYRLGWLAAVGFVLIAVGMTALYAPYYSSFSLQNLIGFFFPDQRRACLPRMLFWSRREGQICSPQFLRGLLYLIFAFLVACVRCQAKPVLSPLLLAVFFRSWKEFTKSSLALRLRPAAGLGMGADQWDHLAVIAVAVSVVPSGSPLVSVMVGLDLFYSGLATIMIAHAMRKTLEKRATTPHRRRLLFRMYESRSVISYFLFALSLRGFARCIFSGRPSQPGDYIIYK